MNIIKFFSLCTDFLLFPGPFRTEFSGLISMKGVRANPLDYSTQSFYCLLNSDYCVCTFWGFHCVLRGKYYGFFPRSLGGRDLKLNTLPCIVEDQITCGYSFISP